MKKVLLSLGMMLCLTTANAQEVKSDIVIVNEIKTVVMTINADRFNDLKNFDWRTNLTEVFKDVPDEAVIGIRINIGSKQLTSDSTTLQNSMSLYQQDYAKYKERLLTNVVKTVQNFVDDDQKGNNVD